MKRSNPFGALFLLVFAGGILIFGSSLTAMPERASGWDELPEPVSTRSAIFEPSGNLTLSMRITAYTSSVKETDDTPFITAANTRVRDGVVGTNHLAFGTRIMIPRIFGDKVFVVEDRMHERFPDTIDVWMGSGQAAKRKAGMFGWKFAEVVVLNPLDAPPHAE